MDDPKQTEKLQQQLNELNDQLDSFREKTRLLQAELNQLKNTTGEQVLQTELKRNTKQHYSPKNYSLPLENFIGLRLIHLVGIVVLVTGLSIGVKYAVSRQLISETARIILAYSAGATLYFISFRLKKKYRLFSAILFSGAMASLYFTTYAAFVYYGFIPFAAAFGFMVMLTCFTVYNAIRYNRQEIAVLGMTGAYAIPFLISANDDRADLFFSFILLINLGVLFLSFKKPWKIMGRLSMLVTWVLFIGWLIIHNTEAGNGKTGYVFMSVFYILFLAAAMAFKLFRRQNLAMGQVQQILLNNIALFVSLLLMIDADKFEQRLQMAAAAFLILSGIILLLSVILLPGENLFHRILAIQTIITLIFFIGVEWNGLTVTVLWVLLSAMLFAGGVFFKKTWPRMLAILLMAFTLGKLILVDSTSFSTVQKIIACILIGTFLLILSFVYQKMKWRLFGNIKEE